MHGPVEQRVLLEVIAHVNDWDARKTTGCEANQAGVEHMRVDELDSLP